MKLKQVVIAGCVVALLALTVYLLESTETSTRLPEHKVRLELTERAGEFNRTLPRLLDEHTKFQYAEADHLGMRFVYSLIQVDRLSHDSDDLKRQIRPQIEQQYCQNDAFEFYRRHAQFFEIVYRDQNDQFLFTLRFDPSSCSE